MIKIVRQYFMLADGLHECVGVVVDGKPSVVVYDWEVKA